VGDDNETWFTAGDLVISIDSLADNAKQFSVSENEELKRLLIHGILHLNGMDHTTNDTDEEMLQVQEKILAGFSGEVIIKD
jgi:probable rRNA maturation factor